MCSLQEAFQSFSEEPARIEDGKRRKKRRAALPPPEPLIVDPDRPTQPPPPAEQLTGSPATNTTSTSFSDMLTATQSANYFPNPSSDVDNESVYTLTPDWTTVFNDTSAPEWIRERMPPKQAEQPLIPSPWIDGAPTLWESISPDYKNQPGLRQATQQSDSRLDALQRKLDAMFEKMDAMDRVRSESMHIEIILFVLGGIFLILLIDLLVKQGTQASMFYAAAGVPSVGMMGGWTRG